MKKKNPIHAAENSEQLKDLFAAIDRDVRTERYRTLVDKTEKGAHPTREQLHKYSAGQLTGKPAMGVRKHIAFCRKCAQEVAAIMRIEQEVEQELFEWADEEPVFNEIATPEPPVIPMSETKERIEWLVEGTGLALTASTRVTTKKKVFETPLGKIEITCSWGKEYDDKIFVRIDWNAEQEIEDKFEIQLINALTQKILYTVSSETIKKGDAKRFYASELGLNPFQEKLVISLVLLESM